MTGGKIPNSVLKRILELFSKFPPLKKINCKINYNKENCKNLYKKENFKPEVKLTIENLQNELHQLKNKQPKGAKHGATFL